MTMSATGTDGKSSQRLFDAALKVCKEVTTPDINGLNMDVAAGKTLQQMRESSER